MRSHPRSWPLAFYFYRQRVGLAHRLRLKIDETVVSNEERTYIEYYESHIPILPRRFHVYQRLWFFPHYIYRPDIHSVTLDQQFFYGIPTSLCLFSLGCAFVLIEKTENLPFIIS